MSNVTASHSLKRLSAHLDEADPGLDVDAGVPEAGVEPQVLDLAEEAEQGVHLVPGGLGRDVGHLQQHWH